MTRLRPACAAAAAMSLAAIASPALAADQLLIVDSGGDRVMLFDAADGSPIDLDWLTDLGAVGWVFSTPKEAARVGNEYWVSDQVADAIHRFDLNRVFISSITTRADTGAPLDNMRGFGIDPGRVYLCNAGSPISSTVQRYAHDGSPLGAFTTGGGAFDAEPWMGDLLVSNDTGTDAIQRWTTGGVFVSNFASGAPINTPQQLVILPDSSVLLANSLGAVGSRGLIHYNPDGTTRAFVDVISVGNPPTRGGMLLDNGDYLVSTSSGIFRATSDGGGGFALVSVQAGVDGQFIVRIPGPPDPCPQDLDGDGMVGAGDLALLLGSWGMGGPADFDGGGVSASDLALLLGAWGPCP